MNEVIALAEKHRKTWRDKPQAYWLMGLLEEVFELIGSLIGLHKDPVELELPQIATICINWIEMRKDKMGIIEVEEDGTPYEEECVHGVHFGGYNCIFCHPEKLESLTWLFSDEVPGENKDDN